MKKYEPCLGYIRCRKCIPLMKREAGITCSDFDKLYFTVCPRCTKKVWVFESMVFKKVENTEDV